MKLNATEKNALKAVEYLLWETKVKVTSTGLKEDLVMHPDFPSVASISDAFTEWQVPNMATRLNSLQLHEIPLPSLVYLNLNGGMLAPLKSVTADSVEWLDTQRGWQKEPIFNFEQKWNGVTLLLEPGEKSGEVKYLEKSGEQFVSNLRIPFLISGTVVCLLIVLSLNWNSLQYFGLPFQLQLGLKLAGSVVGGLLLWQSLDAGNPFLQNICHLSSKNNCNNILQSKAAKITPLLSWSEIGFVYFAGGLVAMLLALVIANFSIINYLAILSLAAFPFTIYSVWYQHFIAKYWCVLCLLVQVLLWGEMAIVLVFSEEFKSVWDLRMFFILSLAFLIPINIWIAIKKPLIESAQLFDVQRELQKVKFDENYIKTVFSNGTKMPPIFEDMQTASMGNQDASDMLTVVTNPLCGPCSRLHGELNELLENNSNFRCQFVFLGPPKAWQIAANFLSTSKADRKTLMESWYSNIQQSQEKWIETHRIEINPDEVNHQFKLHGRWCELSGVKGTPTVFINGVELPTAFKIKDLKRVVSLLNRVEDITVTI